MTTFRMHPDDLKAHAKMVAEELKPELREILGKETQINKIQTFTVKEAAKLLNMEANTLYGHIAKGLLKTSRTGKKHIITQQQLNDYIDGSHK